MGNANPAVGIVLGDVAQKVLVGRCSIADFRTAMSECFHFGRNRSLIAITLFAQLRLPKKRNLDGGRSNSIIAALAARAATT